MAGAQETSFNADGSPDTRFGVGGKLIGNSAARAASDACRGAVSVVAGHFSHARTIGTVFLGALPEFSTDRGKDESPRAPAAG